MSARAKSAAAAAFLAVWFLSQTWRGMFVDVTEDDLMNMYYAAWRIPLWKLFLANLTPFTSVYRPFGSLSYDAIYSVAGLHALPFRVFAYAVMLLNIWLVYRVTTLLTGSSWTGLLCALIFSYHKRLYALLVNGGTIYDLLSFTFFLLAFAFYVSARRGFGNVTGWRLLAFCALYTLALNSKEMAASLPAILLVYELAFHRDSVRAGVRWLYDRRAMWIAAAMTALAFAFRRTRGSSFFGVPDYDLHFTPAQYFSTTNPLLSQLFFLPENALGAWQSIAVFASVLALALALRDRLLVLAAAIAILAPLPINFIAYRGFFVMYLPVFGWALFFAVLLQRMPCRVPRAAILLAVAIGLFAVETQDTTWTFADPRPEEARIHRMRKDLATIHDATPKPRRVLFLHQAVDPTGYVPLYILRLLYRDPYMAVDVSGSPHAPDPIRPESYDLIIDFCQGRYVKGPCP